MFINQHYRIIGIQVCQMILYVSQEGKSQYSTGIVCNKVSMYSRIVGYTRRKEYKDSIKYIDSIYQFNRFQQYFFIKNPARK